MKVTLGEKISSYINILILGIIGLTTLVPFIYVISTSFAPETEVLKHGMVLVAKTGFSIDVFKFILISGSGIR